jgi:hypothetical protein
VIFRCSLRVAVPVVALILSTAACSASPPAGPAATVDVPQATVDVPAATTAPPEGQSERGLLVKRPGDVAQFELRRTR